MERKANNGGDQSLLVQKLQLNAGAAFPVPTGESIHFMHGGGDYGPEVIRAEVHPLGGRGSVGQAVGNACPDDRIEAGTEQRPDLFKESERNCAKSEEHIFMISSSEGGSGSSSSSRGLHVGESIFSDQKPSLSSISKDSGGSVGGLPKIPLLTKFNCTYKRSNPVGTAKRVLTLVKDANRSGTPELPVITTKERCLAESRYNERPNNNGSCLDARKRKAESEPSVSHFHGEISRADAKLMEGRCMLSPGSSVISNDFKGRKNIEFGKDLVDSRWDSNDKENINPVKDHRRCTGKGREFSNQVIAGDKHQSKAPEKLRNARKLPNTGRVTSQTSFSLLKQLTEGKMPKALMQVAPPLEDPNADEKADKDRYVPTARISSVTHATSIKDLASFLNPPAMAERHCEGVLPASCVDLEIELREASPYLVGETLVTPEMECLTSSSNAQVRSADAKRISSVPINSLNQQEGCSGVSLPSALFGPHGIAESHVQGIEHGKFSLSSSCPTLPATSTLPSIASSSINSQSQHFMRDDIPTLRKPSPCSGDDLIDSMTPGATCVAEVSESKVMPTSVRDLTSSLSSLSIVDSLCQEDLHASYVNQKTGSTGADSHPVGKTHCSSEMDIKPCSSSNQLGSVPDEARTVISLSGPIADLNQKQGCSIVSMQSSSFAPLANARRHVQEIEHGKSSLSSAYSVSHVSSIPSFITPSSITLRTASAPLASSFSDGHLFMEDNIQALKKPTLCSADEILKASHGSHVGGAPSKASLPTTSGLERAPQVELPMSGGEQPIDGSRQGSQVDKPKPEGEVPKSAVFSQVNDISEKKGFIGGEAVVQQKKRWENEHYIWVNGKRYQKLGKIGSGGSSEVYKVIASDCTIYALKRIKLKGRDYSSACGFHQEINYLEKLRGKSSIIQLIDFEVTDKSLFNGELRSSHTIRDDVYIYMVLEYGEIDLAHMLADKWKERSRGNKPLDENWLRLYWHQILEAVNTIHEERIVHSDLKPANFLLVKGVLKLIDFGIAKAIQNDTTNIVRESQVGTLNYMSPEAFMMNEKDEHGQVVKCGRSSDIWSLGCILYQMVYGSTPFSNITNLWAKVKEITNRNHKIKFPPLSNPFLLDIMKKCLAWNRDERLRIPQLLEHPFLRPHAALIFNPHNKQHIMDALLHIQQDYQFHPDIQILTQQLMEKLRSLEAPTNVLASE